MRNTLLLFVPVISLSALLNVMSAKESSPSPSDDAEQAAASTPLPPNTDWSKVDWKSLLTDEQYRVTQRAGTERPFYNAYWDNKKPGEYRCVCCGLLLFKSESKFDAHCGWPSFDKPEKEGAISEHVDQSHGMSRTETRCSRCGAHLGHVFDDGPTPTGLRYCMNSASMRFVPDEADSTQEQPKSAKEN